VANDHDKKSEVETAELNKSLRENKTNNQADERKAK